MIRAVIFDCFGVLAGDGWLPFKDKYFGHDPQLIAEVTDLNKQADAGFASYDEFMNRVSELAGIPVKQAAKEIEDNPANTRLFEFIATLKLDYKIGMLSNAADDWMEELFTEEQRELFDALALSYETGFIKPDERAYAIITSRLGVEMHECIFIDDQERYCAGAREVGMQTVQFQSTDQTIEAIKAILTKS